MTLQVIKGGEAMGIGLADYVYLGTEGDLDAKKRSILIGTNGKGEPEPILDRWIYDDGPPDDDEDGDDQTLILVPCFYLPDPTRPQPCYIVICEVRDVDDNCVEHNGRAKLREALEARGMQTNLVWFGFEQNYLLEDTNQPEDGFEARRFQASERHIGACFDSGILFHSAWNTPGAVCDWDFKVGYRGFPQDFDPDPPNALIVADHLIVARYLMQKIAGSKGLDPDWKHLSIFLSTAEMREPGGDCLAEVIRLEEALEDEGDIRRLPHPKYGGVQCLELRNGESSNPYSQARTVLESIWPLTILAIREE